MVKVNVLYRDPEQYCRETSNDLQKVFHNADEKLHPFKAAREYTRALNAAKLDRMFAKPFVSSLSGHKEGISQLDRHPHRISWIASGANDGELRMWDLSTGSCLLSYQAFSQKINGVNYSPSGKLLLISGLESNVQILSIHENQTLTVNLDSSRTIKGVQCCMDYSNSDNRFATGGDFIHLWDTNNQEPTYSYELSSEVITALKFNKVETYLFGACSSDKGFSLYDVRQTVKCAKIKMSLRPSSLSWNPQEANVVVLGSEDSNCYLFDIRNLSKPLKVYSDHTNSVLDVDFSPTGQEFASACYDRSLRIFSVNHNKSREVYHTQRMQRLFCVMYTSDSQYIACGSDEMNIRLWKTNSSTSQAYMRPREKAALNYNSKLVNKYHHYPEIRKIKNHRHLPRHIYSATQKKKVEEQAEKRRSENSKLFSKQKRPKPNPIVDIEK